MYILRPQVYLSNTQAVTHINMASKQLSAHTISNSTYFKLSPEECQRKVRRRSPDVEKGLDERD